MNSPGQRLNTVKSKDVNWAAIWRGYALSLTGTLVLGIPLFLVAHNVWLIAIAGTLSLFAGGFAAARRAQTSEPLNGALVGVLYFATITAVIFLGAITDKLPDPLPGLPKGDSTFFMAWPLVQLLASTLGGLVGGRGIKAGKG